MQQYAEVLVRANHNKKTDRSKKRILIAGIVIAVLIVAVSAYIMGQFPGNMSWSVIPFTLLLLLVTAWGILTALERQQLEYEYAVSDQSVTVDCVRAQKNRKQLLHLPLSTVTSFGKHRDDLHPDGRTVLDASGTPAQEGVWYLDYHSEKGAGRLIICPNQAALEILKHALRRVTVREDLK